MNAGDATRRRMLWLLIGFAVTGVASGLVWEGVWTPPTGVVMSHAFYLDDRGLTRDFSGAGLYALVAAPAGLGLGFLTALVLRGRARAALVTCLVGAVLAGVLMAVVGPLVGPPDPAVAARSLDDYATLVEHLRVTARSAYLAWPIGALAGALLGWALVGSTHTRGRRR